MGAQGLLCLHAALPARILIAAAPSTGQDGALLVQRHGAAKPYKVCVSGGGG
jgi:hypothetical protein